MNEEQTKEFLLDWCKSPVYLLWSLTKEGCCTPEYFKFMEYYNKYWGEWGSEDYVSFVRGYAETLNRE